MNKYRKMLKIIEEDSTCIRLHVGAIIVLDDRIVSTGWNGVPAKHEHCCDRFKDHSDKDMLEQHKEFSEKNEIHAEQNAIAFAARKGISTENCDIYVSISPCTACAKLIIAAGIKRVFYETLYDRETYGLDLLKKSGVELIDLKNSNE